MTRPRCRSCKRLVRLELVPHASRRGLGYRCFYCCGLFCNLCARRHFQATTTAAALTRRARRQRALARRRRARRGRMKGARGRAP